jgi:N-acetylmuramoyl-L-alanine amidase
MLIGRAMSEAIIVLDPGHGGTGATVGGSSPGGAVGPSGVREKDVTWALATALRRHLGERSVFLTRAGDVNLSLTERASISRRHGARAFVSLHANAGQRGVRGAESWVHSRAGSHSRRLAERVQRALVGQGVPDRGVKAGPLGVLAPERHAPSTAACLVEVDFLSDPSGEARLGDPREVESLARVLAEALQDFLRQPLMEAQSDSEGWHPDDAETGEEEDGRGTTAQALSSSCPAVTTAAWAPDADSPDLRHVGALSGPVSAVFDFTPAHLEALCELNDFAVGTDATVVFGLRGCALVGTPDGQFHPSVQLELVEPNHKDSRCVIGVWQRTPGQAPQLAVFPGSTVPHRNSMRKYACGGDKANMMLTGLHRFTVGRHKKVPGALVANGREVVVVRTTDDLVYEVTDTFERGAVGDNLHPSFKTSTGSEFSSAGCQTVRGNYTDDGHVDPPESVGWSTFRQRLGLTTAGNPSTRTEFWYVLLTGREAWLVTQPRYRPSLRRLRFGSSGPGVQALQQALARERVFSGTADGAMGPVTTLALITLQQRRDGGRADGIVTPELGLRLGFDLVGQASVTPHGLSHEDGHECGIDSYEEDAPAAWPAALQQRRAVSRDEVLQELDRRTGSRHGSYASWTRGLVQGSVFGVSIRGGVRPELLAKLQAAEADAERRLRAGGQTGPIRWGVHGIGGYQNRKGYHGWGLAVDINADTCPYIMHEAGEAELDREVAPVYERIARMMLSRSESLVPRAITQGGRGVARTEHLLVGLGHESQAMVDYFALMQDVRRLEAFIQAHPDVSFWAHVLGSPRVPTAAWLQARMAEDYVALAGRDGPSVPGLTYPSARRVLRSNGTVADRPFVGRRPERGFLDLDFEVVMALARQGLRWGATDFGGASGDVMHFDDGDSQLGRALRTIEDTLSRQPAPTQGQGLERPGRSELYG